MAKLFSIYSECQSFEFDSLGIVGRLLAHDHMPVFICNSFGRLDSQAFILYLTFEHQETEVMASVTTNLFRLEFDIQVHSTFRRG